MSQVLITGATGFVGGRLAHHLRARGDDVVALVRTPSDDLAAAGVEQLAGGLDALDGDLAARVDAIVHAAASVDQDLEVARRVNRDGTRRLADHARRAGDVRFVHVSTTSVYDLAAIGDTVADESAPLMTADGAVPATSSSASAYAVTKAEGEAEVARAVADGLSAAILRPPAVLGAGPTSTWGTRVPTRLREGALDPPHPSTTFGWVHVDDLVDAITAAIDQPVEATVNVVGGHTTFGSYMAAVRAAIPDAPEPPEPREDARRWGGAYATDRLPRALGVTPRRTFDEAMAEIHAWWSDARTG
jgi:2-alkyl-3-oxoalkanoate reductase